MGSHCFHEKANHRCARLELQLQRMKLVSIMNEMRYLLQELDTQENTGQEKGKCPPSNDIESVASTGTPRPPVDSLSYFTFNCFREEDYVQDTGIMRLHIAARDNNANSIKKSLEKGVSVYLQDAVGRSALHWAAIFCKLDIVEAIIKLFPVSRLDMGDRNGCTPLHYAVLAGRPDVANMLLKAGCHVHSIDYRGRTPLHYAAQNANACVVSLLLKRGANPSYLDKMARSPYDVAKQYNNSDKILDCLRIEKSKTTPELQKPKVKDPRQKQPAMKTKVVETDGKVSITFYSLTNLGAELTQHRWKPHAPESQQKRPIIESPVEIVKEEMERDTRRMKYKLRMTEKRKETPSEHKLKEQERALKQLLDRSKKNAKEERRKLLAEEDRLRRLAQNRRRSTIPKTCSIPYWGIRTPTESTIGPFQTSRGPSNATSPKCATEGPAPRDAKDEWQEENWDAPCKMQRMPTNPQTPPALETQNGSGKKSAQQQAVLPASEKANPDVSDHQAHPNVQQEQTEPDKEQRGATAPLTSFTSYLNQWFAKGFSFPDVPQVGSLQDESVPAVHIPNINTRTLPAPVQKEEQRNFVGSSFPPLLAAKNHSIPPSDTSGVNNGQLHPFSPSWALSTSSYKSPASFEWDTSRPQSPSESAGTKNSTPPSTTTTRKTEQNLRQKETDLRPGHEQEHTPIKHERCGSHAKTTTNSPKIPSDVGTYHNGRNRSKLHGKFSNKIVSTEEQRSRDEDENSSTQKNKSPKSLVDGPRNRHGFECFSRPKAQHSTRADQRWHYPHMPSTQAWSPEEPWRPGGISKTVVDSKMFDLLKKQRKKPSVQSICSLYRMMQNHRLHAEDTEDIDSDPFSNVKPQEDEEIDHPLVKAIDQQQALWSLREASQRSPGQSDRRDFPGSKPLATQKKLEESIISSLKTKDPSSGFVPVTYPPPEAAVSITQANLGMAGISEQRHGIIPAQTIDEQFSQSPIDETSERCQLDSFPQTNPRQLTQTMPTHPLTSLLPSQLGLQYAFFIQEERQQAHPNPSSYCHPQTDCPKTPRLQPNQQQQAFPYSFQPLQEDLSYPPNSCLQVQTMPLDHPYHISGAKHCPQIPSTRTNPRMLECMLDHESPQGSYRRDEWENRTQKNSIEDYEMGSIQQRDRMKLQSQNSVKRTNSRYSLDRTSSQRLAFMKYYGQSVRPQFIGLGREQAPVHRCIDVETLIKQWI